MKKSWVRLESKAWKFEAGTVESTPKGESPPCAPQRMAKGRLGTRLLVVAALLKLSGGHLDMTVRWGQSGSVEVITSPSPEGGERTHGAPAR